MLMSTDESVPDKSYDDIEANKVLIFVLHDGVPEDC